MSASILPATNIVSAIWDFKHCGIPFSIDFRPDEQFKFVASAKDRDGVHHAKANAHLAIALNELFEVVK
jgi:hypothetical protein